MVKSPSSSAGGVGLIPGQGAKIPRVVAKNLKHKTEAML